MKTRSRIAAAIVLAMITAAARPRVADASPPREVIVHGFRAPSMGVELKQGFVGLHLGL